MDEAKPLMERTLQTKPRDYNGREPAATPAPVVNPVVAETATPETPAAVETPAGETPETPETTETPAAAAPETDPDAEDEDDGGEGPVTPVSGKRTHLRLPDSDKVGRLATALMKRNRDMPMEEAIEKARKQLGVKTEAPKGEVTEANPPGFPDTVDATTAEITKLRAERKEANTNLNFEKATELSDKIEDLHNHRFKLERQGERKQADAEKAYNQQFATSESRSKELYDFAGNPESPGARRMAEIDADLLTNGDPLYHSPDKPLRVAQMVAAELNIAPRKKGAPATPVKPAAPISAAQPAKKQVLPGGGSRTTPPPVNQPPAINAAVAKVQSPAEWRAFKKANGLPV
jgi:hypothetical protein